MRRASRSRESELAHYSSVPRAAYPRHSASSLFSDWCRFDVVEPSGNLRRVEISPHDEGRERGARLRHQTRDSVRHSQRVASQLDRSIEASEARLRVLIETAPIGMVEVDADGRVRWWNRVASRVLACEFVDDPDRPEPTFPEAALTGLRELWSDVERGGPLGGRDFIDVVIAGRPRILTAAAAVLPSSTSSAVSFLTLIDDVTNHREMQVELRHAHTMEVRGQVASRIAHDFNNLLTLITGYAEILSRSLQDNERDLEMVRDIQATASRASLLTTQLQTIGRTMAPEPIEFSPVGVIQSNAEVIERILGDRVSFTCVLDERAGNIRADADQFEQMMLNLSINARDAMPEGGELRILANSSSLDHTTAFELGLSSGDYVVISVVDTGVGMDDETRSRCFKPLFTTKGPFNGTGMGLAAARRLVQESGGVITGKSVLGRGTTFEAYLPVIDPMTKDQCVTVVPGGSRGSATVLLAEDDEGLRRLMSQVLQRNGY